MWYEDGAAGGWQEQGPIRRFWLRQNDDFWGAVVGMTDDGGGGWMGYPRYPAGHGTVESYTAIKAFQPFPVRDYERVRYESDHS